MKPVERIIVMIDEESLQLMNKAVMDSFDCSLSSPPLSDAY